MKEPESIQQALEVVAGNPKIAGTVAVTTTSMGAASVLSQIHTALGLISLAIGCIVGIYVLRINAVKHKIYQRMLKDGESLKE